jgi:hypothetical protein
MRNQFDTREEAGSDAAREQLNMRVAAYRELGDSEEEAVAAALRDLENQQQREPLVRARRGWRGALRELFGLVGAAAFCALSVVALCQLVPLGLAPLEAVADLSRATWSFLVSVGILGCFAAGGGLTGLLFPRKAVTATASLLGIAWLWWCGWNPGGLNVFQVFAREPGLAGSQIACVVAGVVGAKVGVRLCRPRDVPHGERPA